MFFTLKLRKIALVGLETCVSLITSGVHLMTTGCNQQKKNKATYEHHPYVACHRHHHIDRCLTPTLAAAGALSSAQVFKQRTQKVIVSIVRSACTQHKTFVDIIIMRVLGFLIGLNVIMPAHHP